MAIVSSGARTTTTEEVLSRAARAATGFASLGVGRGDTVAVYLRNDFAFLEASFGAGLVGAYPVPVNWHYTEDEARYLFENSGAKAIVIHADLLPAIAPAVPKGVSLMVVETEDAPGFRRGRKLKKLGLDSADTSELFFDDVKLPAENLLGSEEGQGFAQLMNDLPRERLIVVVHAQAMIERALALTIEYVKQRQAFGKKIIEFQNTQFGLAECKSEATIARVFHDHCIERYLSGTLDTVTASMAKYWITDLQGKIIDRCLQFFGGYGYMEEFPISRMYRDARVMRIYAGTNEIMKLLIARSL